jgi:Predicted membrane protein
MMQRLSCLFYGFLKIAANAQRLGLGMIRVAILIIFVWIGGLKFRNYEAEGIVPFVANSPFMSFFYNEKAPEYRDYKLKEGEYDAAKHAWHEKNNTYGFSHGLGLLIMGIGILTFLGFFSARIGLAGELLAVIMTLGTLSFLVTTPEVWVPELGSGEYGFPLLSGAGRLVIKDTAILAGVVVLLSDTARKLLARRRGSVTEFKKGRHCMSSLFVLCEWQGRYSPPYFCRKQICIGTPV